MESGLSWVNGIGIDRIHQRVTCLTGWLLGRLAALRHGNGAPMARIYGPASTRDRGGTVAFNLTKADWRRALRGRARTMDQNLGLLGLPSLALRASVGLASTVDDVERFLAFVELTYRDRVAGTDGLPARRGC